MLMLCNNDLAVWQVHAYNPKTQEAETSVHDQSIFHSKFNASMGSLEKPKKKKGKGKK
jgi:hypothetical protein